MNRRIVADYLGLIVILGLLVLFFGMRSENFFSASVLSMIANQVPSLTVVAVGMTFVLIIGGIDLSVGSVLALSSAVLGTAMRDWNWFGAGTWPLFAAIPLALVVGSCCGVINGIVAVVWSIPSFIVTLGMLEIARGSAFIVTESKTMYLGGPIAKINTPFNWLGLSPAILVALFLVLVAQIVLTRTAFGRHMIAIGDNERAVRLSGIDPRPTKITIFAIAGLLAGLGGVFHAARLATADPNAGIGMELSAIAAVVIGGTSLMGGRGSVVASFLGVLIIAVLQTGLAFIEVRDPTKQIVTGVVIVAAVILDAHRSRIAGKRYALLSRLLGQKEGANG